ncbi:hypothetical protein TCDM_10991 [Trypanosoma cruzi Dm28c]|uniref:Uncharacterized protein n=1 Tax=Trypanosoma cruzi Dm28c TaxID=1416333 RepID=V5D1T1_TRYCR|nr:hypothetical protein TCDM_10991 [Trypanosoma cruzi Dm28c]
MRWTSPNKYGRARPHPTAVALGTGAWPRRNTWRGTAPSRPCGEACRPLAVRWPPTCRGRPAEFATRGCATPPQSGENGIQPRLPPTCNAEQLPQQAHGKHPRRTHPGRHRVPVGSAAIWLFAGKFHPDQLLQIRAAMHRNASQHRTAAYFVDHANAFGTVSPDAVILEMRRLSIHNRIVRWSAACLNNTSAVVCIDKLTPSSRTLTRGAPQRTVLAPIMFVVVMQSRCSCPSNVPYFAEGSLLMTALSSHSRATGMRSTRP